MTTFPDGLVIDGKRYRQEAPGSLPPGRYVRVLHEAEVPAARRNVPHGRPEVRAMFPNHFVQFGRDWQLFAWKKLNPLLKANNMTAIYDDSLWVTNNEGFGNPNDPRANYFENRNLDKPAPKVENITCGGNLLRVLGEVMAKAGERTLEPCFVVETLQWSDPVPSLEWLEARPWLITHAVDLDSNGMPSKFPQGYKHLGYTPGVRHPLVADPKRFRIVIPTWRCVLWTEPTAPDPLNIYL